VSREPPSYNGNKTRSGAALTANGIGKYAIAGVLIALGSLAMGLWLLGSRGPAILVWPVSDWVEATWVIAFPAVWTVIYIKARTAYGDRARLLFLTLPFALFGAIAWVIWLVCTLLFFIFLFGVCMFGVC
jgi:hypothetical protein